MKFDKTMIIFTIVMLVLLILSIYVASKTTDKIKECNEYWVQVMQERGCLSNIDGVALFNYTPETNNYDEYNYMKRVYK